MNIIYNLPLVLFYTFVSIHGEPHCSRFHYEEKLLEKMVRMEIRMEEIERKLETAAEKDGLLEQELKDLKAQKVEKVAFLAKAKSHQLSKRKHETLVFEDVVTNVGSSYDKTCGKFVAPRSGIYIFFSTVTGHNDAQNYLYVSVNDRTIVKMYSRGTGGGHDSSSATVTLQLKAGDIVEIKNTGNSGNFHGNEYSWFGGFLLY